MNTDYDGTNNDILSGVAGIAIMLRIPYTIAESLFFILLSLVICSSCISSPMQTLREYMDRDLRCVSVAHASDVARAAMQVAEGSSVRPLYVAEMRTDLASNLLVYVESELPNNLWDDEPEDYNVLVRILRPEQFSCSLPPIRIGNEETRLEDVFVSRYRDGSEGADFLVLRTGYGIFPNTQEVVYGFVNMEPPFCLRVLRSKSGPSQQLSFARYHVHGGHWRSEIGHHLVPSPNSADAWVDILEHGSLTEVLATLYFLCGEQEDTSDCLSREISETTTLLNAKSHQTLANLLTHQNPWVREYAAVLQKKIARGD